ncbi:conserved exported hypothetical protein [Burkholderiales bacterium]|nr:conserved exported hypothetical protein [Burkholderiales bacterium]
MTKYFLMTSLCFATIAATSVAHGQDSPARVELKRTDLTGTQETEVISSISEYQPGDELPRHSHHGVEMLYVVQGAMIQFPGKDPAMLSTGTALMNLRDVPHAGFKIVGDKSLKLFTVHVVDKGKPLYEMVK